MYFFTTYAIKEAIQDLIIDFDIKEGMAIKDCSVDPKKCGSRSMFISAIFRDVESINIAVMSGAKILMIDEECMEEINGFVNLDSCSVILVKDIMAALKALAIYRRKNILKRQKIIAITGSLGKTMVSKMSFEIISKKFKVFVSKYPYDSEISVPLVICNAPASAAFIVIEVGIGKKSENNVDCIAKISEYIRPDISILTCVGIAHMSAMRGLSNLTKAKAGIFYGINNGGVAIVGDEIELMDIVKDRIESSSAAGVISVGTKNKSQIHINNLKFIKPGLMSYKIVIRDGENELVYDCTLNKASIKFASISIFGVAIARLLNIDVMHAIKAISRHNFDEGRGEVRLLSRNNNVFYVMNNVINPGIDSFLDNLDTSKFIKKDFNAKRIICIVSDIHVQEEFPDDAKEAISSKIQSAGVDFFITFGPGGIAMNKCVPGSIQKEHFEHKGQVLKKIRSLIKDGDLIIVKSSKKSQSFEIIDKIYR